MAFEILLVQSAIDDLNALDARRRSTVRAGMETHLRHNPTKESKSRIKRLRGLKQPQYRLRIDDMRVFYDVAEHVVSVLAVVPKDGAEEWLKTNAETNDDPSTT